MAREIHCAKCKTYLGEIRDAKLRKDMEGICSGCLKTLTQKALAADMNHGPFNIFDGIFRKGA